MNLLTYFCRGILILLYIIAPLIFSIIPTRNTTGITCSLWFSIGCSVTEFAVMIMLIMEPIFTIVPVLVKLNVSLNSDVLFRVSLVLWGVAQVCFFAVAANNYKNIRSIYLILLTCSAPICLLFLYFCGCSFERFFGYLVGRTQTSFGIHKKANSSKSCTVAIASPTSADNRFQQQQLIEASNET